MNEHVANDVKEGLDFYDPENRVFQEIADKIPKGQKLSKRDLLLILKWKLGRLKDANSRTIADENMDEINRAVRDARVIGCRSDAVKALEALEKVPGIGLATATAILTVCYPGEFTIIDQRVLEVLDLFPPTCPVAKRQSKDYRSDDWTAAEYVDEYLPKVKERSRRWGCTLRNADQALWGLSVKRRVEELIAKS